MLADRHTVQLPVFQQPMFDHKQSVASAETIAEHWITRFESALQSNDASQLTKLLHQDCWWRDMLALSWDFRTIHGLDKVSVYLSENFSLTTLHNLRLRETGKFAPSFSSPTEGVMWLESMFEFQTQFGSGKGMLRLVQDSNGLWKGYMMYTALQELKGFPDKVGSRRPHGGNNSLVAGAVKGNWSERRQRQISFVDEDPAVVIVGAGKHHLEISFSDTDGPLGQAGLNVGARLQALGLSCLIIDKNERIGDNWRGRYRVSSLRSMKTLEPTRQDASNP